MILFFLRTLHSLQAVLDQIDTSIVELWLWIPNPGNAIEGYRRLVVVEQWNVNASWALFDSLSTTASTSPLTTTSCISSSIRTSQFVLEQAGSITTTSHLPYPLLLHNDYLLHADALSPLPPFHLFHLESIQCIWTNCHILQSTTIGNSSHGRP